MTVKRSLFAQQSQPETPAPTAVAVYNPAAPPPSIVKTSLPSTPYVMFYHPLSPNAGKIKSAVPSVQEADPVLVDGETITKLDPFQAFFVTGVQFWAQENSKFEPEKVRFTRPDRADKTWKPYVDTMLLVVVGPSLVPATCRFKATKTNAAEEALSTLAQAADPSWGDKSAAHRVTLALPSYARFLTTVNVVNRTAKSSGRLLKCTEAKIDVTNVDHIKRFTDFFRSPEARAECEAVEKSYLNRCEEIRQKEVK